MSIFWQLCSFLNTILDLYVFVSDSGFGNWKNIVGKFENLKKKKKIRCNHFVVTAKYEHFEASY